MHLRRLMALIAVCLALLLGISQPRLIAAQDPGDQIVEMDDTPTPEADDAEDEPAQSQDDDAEATAEADANSEDDAASGDDTEAAADDDESPFDVSPGDRMIVIEDLNLREEADVEADVIQMMPQDSIVTIAGDGKPVNDYLPVNYEEDAGWAYIPFLVHEDMEDNLAETTGELNLREGPNADDDVIEVMPEGSEVRVVDVQTDDEGVDWNRVYFEGDLGWAAADYIEFVDPDDDATPASDRSSSETTTTTTAPSPDLITVVDSNLREGPGTEEAVVQVVPFGTYATATGEASNGFVPVTVDGVQGWLSTDVIAPAEIAAEITGETTTSTDTTTESTTATGDPSDDEPRTTLEDVNLLTEPRDDADVIVIIPAGTTVTLTYDGYENGYIAISYDGMIGWVIADLLTP